MSHFYPLRTPNEDARQRHMEEALVEMSRIVDTLQARVSPLDPTGRTPQAQGVIVSTTGSGGGSGGGATGSLNESQVVFDPTGGHRHDGTDSRAVALAGDVTGSTGAAVVAKIEGKPIAAPGVGQDKQFVRYDNGGAQFVYANASTNALLGAWGKADISTLGGADAELDNSLSVAATRTLAVVCPISGAATALSVKLSGSVGTAGNNLVVTVYKNGSSTALTATVTGGASPSDQIQVSGASVTFAAGDTLTVQAHKVGAPAAVQAIVQVWGYFTG